MILAGDIGGTKTILALFEKVDGDLRPVREATFRSREHESLEAILEKFLRAGSRPPLESAVFGVAGAVIEGRSRITNLPWALDERHLARQIGTAQVKLINDLEAAAYGILHLPPSECSFLNNGPKPKRNGNVAVIAAGTGLGEAMLYWDGREHHPIASEGGHADFAPRTDQEIALLKYLRAQLGGRVSYERVLSGPGIYNVYRFLREVGSIPESPNVAEKLEHGDPAEIIAYASQAGNDRLSVATIDLFTSIYGAEAGNWALKCLALGGVFVGGGIAPKLLPALKKGSFMQSFTDKGRFSAVLKAIEVKVALNPRAPLLGAARYALRL